MRDFKELSTWQRAHRLALEVHWATRSFPADERGGLTSQLRRTAASVAMNIAEGCGREGDHELARFLSLASGSLSGTEYHLLLALDLQYLSPDAHDRLSTLVAEARRSIAGLRRQLSTMDPETTR